LAGTVGVITLGVVTDSSTRPEPGPGGPGGDPAAPRRRGRLRLVLLVLAGVLGVGCVGGLGAGYLLYDKATQPDRSTPTAVVRQYVEATFNDRDESRSRLFTCRSPRDIAEIQDLIASLEAKERQYGFTASVGLANTSTRINGKIATVALDLKVNARVEGANQRDIQRWEFRLEDRSGWRVCDAHRIA
jgi:hypothetical protein